MKNGWVGFYTQALFNQVTSSSFRAWNNKWSSSIHFFILPFTKVEIFCYMYLTLNYLFSNQKLFIPHKLYCRNNGLGKHIGNISKILLWEKEKDYSVEISLFKKRWQKIFLVPAIFTKDFKNIKNSSFYWKWFLMLLWSFLSFWDQKTSENIGAKATSKGEVYRHV